MSGNSTSAQKEFDEIRAEYTKLHGLYRKYFPKVDPKLVEEIISQTPSSAKSKGLLYALRVIATEGTNFDRVREYFIAKTGRVPTSYETEVHQVILVYPTLDMIKEIQGYEEVEHISGECTYVSYSVA